METQREYPRNRQDINLLLKVRCTRLEHSQNLHDTTPHNHEHEEHDKALTYGWIIDMLPRFTNRDMSSFVNIFVEFGTSIAEATWCWLCWFMRGGGVIHDECKLVDRVLLGNNHIKLRVGEIYIACRGIKNVSPRAIFIQTINARNIIQRT